MLRRSFAGKGLSKSEAAVKHQEREDFTRSSQMQVASSSAAVPPTTQQHPAAGEAGPPMAANLDPRLAQYKVIRRNGAVVGFEPSKIAIALTKAFLAVNGGQSAASARVRELTAQLTDVVVGALMRRKPEGGARPLDLARLKDLVQASCEDLADVEPERILKATLKDLYDGVPMDEVRKCVVLAA